MKVKKSLILSVMLLVMIAISLNLTMVQADTDSTNVVGINYANGEFTADQAGYTVAVSGKGIVSSNLMQNAYHFSDITSYLSITAPADKAWTDDENGLSLSYRHRSTTNVNGSENEGTEAYEQLFSVENVEDGTAAYICFGGIYYRDSAGKINNATPTSGSGDKALLITKEKDVLVSISADAKSIYVYVDGLLAYSFDSPSSKVIPNAANLFLSVARQQGSTLYIRKGDSQKQPQMSTTAVLSDVKIYSKAFTADEALARHLESVDVDAMNFEEKIAIDYKNGEFTTNDQNYEIKVEGSGIVADDTLNGGYRFSDIKSQLILTAKNGEAISESGAITIEFKIKVSSIDDAGYNEQLFSVKDLETGDSANVCMGRLYTQENGTKIAPDTVNNEILKSLTEQHVVLSIDPVNYTIDIYVNGQHEQYYYMSNSKCDAVEFAIDLFKTELSKENGSLYIRMPHISTSTYNKKVTTLADVRIYDRAFTAAEAAVLYRDGNISVDVYSNLSNETETFIGKRGKVIPNPTANHVGYKFKGYYLDADYNTALAEGATFNPDVKVLYAKYELEEYTIRYHLNGGTQSEENNVTTYTVLSDGITIHPIEKAGYTFDGWYRTEDFKNQIPYIVAGSVGDVDLYAKFTLNTYGITYELNGGLLTEDVVENYTVETSQVELCDAWKPGYTFDGWYADSEFENEVQTFDVTWAKDVTLYAKYTILTYSINYELNGGVIENAPTEYTVESQINLVDASKNGYTFDGWFIDEELAQKVENFDVTLADDITLYAKYSIEFYIIDYVLNGGTVENARTAYTVEEQVDLVNATKNGYTFDGWYADANLTQKVETFDVNWAKDVTLYAKFTVVNYTISYNLDGGTAQDAPTTYNVEDQITLVNAVKEGYTFDGWYMDADYTQAVQAFDATWAKDVTLYAKFTKNQEPTSSSCIAKFDTIPFMFAIFGVIALFMINKKRREMKK